MESMEKIIGFSNLSSVFNEFKLEISPLVMLTSARMDFK